MEQTLYVPGCHVRSSKPLPGLEHLISGRSNFFAELAQNVGLEVQRLLRYTLMGYANPLTPEVEKKAEADIQCALSDILKQLSDYVETAVEVVSSNSGDAAEGQPPDADKRILEGQLDASIAHNQKLEEKLEAEQAKALRLSQQLKKLRVMYQKDLDFTRDRFRSILTRHLGDLSDLELGKVLMSMGDVEVFNIMDFYDDETKEAVQRQTDRLKGEFSIERDVLEKQIKALETTEADLQSRMTELQREGWQKDLQIRRMQGQHDAEVAMQAELSKRSASKMSRTADNYIQLLRRVEEQLGPDSARQLRDLAGMAGVQLPESSGAVKSRRRQAMEAQLLESNVSGCLDNFFKEVVKQEVEGTSTSVVPADGALASANAILESEARTKKAEDEVADLKQKLEQVRQQNQKVVDDMREKVKTARREAAVEREKAATAAAHAKAAAQSATAAQATLDAAKTALHNHFLMSTNPMNSLATTPETSPLTYKRRMKERAHTQAAAAAAHAAEKTSQMLEVPDGAARRAVSQPPPTIGEDPDSLTVTDVEFASESAPGAVASMHRAPSVPADPTSNVADVKSKSPSVAESEENVSDRLQSKSPEEDRTLSKASEAPSEAESLAPAVGAKDAKSKPEDASEGTSKGTRRKKGQRGATKARGNSKPRPRARLEDDEELLSAKSSRPETMEQLPVVDPEEQERRRSLFARKAPRRVPRKKQATEEVVEDAAAEAAEEDASMQKEASMKPKESGTPRKGKKKTRSGSDSPYTLPMPGQEYFDDQEDLSPRAQRARRRRARAALRKRAQEMGEDVSVLESGSDNDASPTDAVEASADAEGAFGMGMDDGMEDEEENGEDPDANEESESEDEEDESDEEEERSLGAAQESVRSGHGRGRLSGASSHRASSLVSMPLADGSSPRVLHSPASPGKRTAWGSPSANQPMSGQATPMMASPRMAKMDPEWSDQQQRAVLVLREALNADSSPVGEQDRQGRATSLTRAALEAGGASPAQPAPQRILLSPAPSPKAQGEQSQPRLPGIGPEASPVNSPARGASVSPRGSLAIELPARSGSFSAQLVEQQDLVVTQRLPADDALSATLGVDEGSTSACAGEQPAARQAASTPQDSAELELEANTPVKTEIVSGSGGMPSPASTRTSFAPPQPVPSASAVDAASMRSVDSLPPRTPSKERPSQGSFFGAVPAFEARLTPAVLASMSEDQQLLLQSLTREQQQRVVSMAPDKQDLFFSMPAEEQNFLMNLTSEQQEVVLSTAPEMQQLIKQLLWQQHKRYLLQSRGEGDTGQMQQSGSFFRATGSALALPAMSLLSAPSPCSEKAMTSQPSESDIMSGSPSMGPLLSRTTSLRSANRGWVRMDKTASQRMQDTVAALSGVGSPRSCRQLAKLAEDGSPTNGGVPDGATGADSGTSEAERPIVHDVLTFNRETQTEEVIRGFHTVGVQTEDAPVVRHNETRRITAARLSAAHIQQIATLRQSQQVKRVKESNSMNQLFETGEEDEDEDGDGENAERKQSERASRKSSKRSASPASERPTITSREHNSRRAASRQRSETSAINPAEDSPSPGSPSDGSPSLGSPSHSSPRSMQQKTSTRRLAVDAEDGAEVASEEVDADIASQIGQHLQKRRLAEDSDSPAHRRSRTDGRRRSLRAPAFLLMRNFWPMRSSQSPGARSRRRTGGRSTMRILRKMETSSPMAADGEAVSLGRRRSSADRRKTTMGQGVGRTLLEADGEPTQDGAEWYPADDNDEDGSLHGSSAEEGESEAGSEVAAMDDITQFFVETVDVTQQTDLKWEEIPEKIIQWLKANLLHYEQAELYNGQKVTTELPGFPEVPIKKLAQLVKNFMDWLDEVMVRTRPTKHEMRRNLRKKYRAATRRDSLPPPVVKPAWESSDDDIQVHAPIEFPFIVRDIDLASGMWDPRRHRGRSGLMQLLRRTQDVQPERRTLNQSDMPLLNELDVNGRVIVVEQTRPTLEEVLDVPITDNFEKMMLSDVDQDPWCLSFAAQRGMEVPLPTYRKGTKEAPEQPEAEPEGAGTPALDEADSQPKPPNAEIDQKESTSPSHPAPRMVKLFSEAMSAGDDRASERPTFDSVMQARSGGPGGFNIGPRAVALGGRAPPRNNSKLTPRAPPSESESYVGSVSWNYASNTPNVRHGLGPAHGGSHPSSPGTTTVQFPSGRNGKHQAEQQKPSELLQKLLRAADARRAAAIEEASKLPAISSKKDGKDASGCSAPLTLSALVKKEDGSQTARGNGPSRGQVASEVVQNETPVILPSIKSPRVLAPVIDGGTRTPRKG